MKLKIGNEELELVYSFRSSIYFESIAGHSLDFTKLTSNDLITLFYSVFVATLQKSKKPIIAMTDFLDIVDENGGEKCLVDFSNWYIGILKAQYELLAEEKEGNKEKPVKSNGKKSCYIRVLR